MLTVIRILFSISVRRTGPICRFHTNVACRLMRASVARGHLASGRAGPACRVPCQLRSGNAGPLQGSDSNTLMRLRVVVHFREVYGHSGSSRSRKNRRGLAGTGHIYRETLRPSLARCRGGRRCLSRSRWRGHSFGLALDRRVVVLDGRRVIQHFDVNRVVRYYTNEVN